MTCGCSNDTLIKVFYNNLEIDPPPLISSLTKELAKNGAGQAIGTFYTITLEGWVFSTSGGFQDVLAKKQALLDIFDIESGYDLSGTCDTRVNENCSSLEIRCGESDTIFKALVKISSPLSFGLEGDNWSQKIPWTITFTSHSISTDVDPVYEGCLKNTTENWTIERDPNYTYYTEDLTVSPGNYYDNCDTNDVPTSTGVQYISPYAFTIRHEIAAQAEDCCISGTSNPSGTFTEGWDVAKQWVECRIGLNTGYIENLEPGLCFDNTYYYDHILNISSSRENGEYSATETWVMLNSSTSGFMKNALEDYTVEVREQKDDQIKTVTVNGRIRGLESSLVDQSACINVLTTKIDSAESYYNTIKQYIPARAYNALGTRLNPLPLDISVVRSPSAGTINYNYTYNDKCCDYLTNYLSGVCDLRNEDVNIVDDFPTDIYAEINILGKQCPIFQPLNMKTKGQKTINLDLTLEKSCDNLIADLVCAPCADGVNDFLDDVYTQLSGLYGSVQTDSDAQNWNPKNGQYTRSIQYSYTCCNNYPAYPACTGEGGAGAGIGYMIIG